MATEDDKRAGKDPKVLPPTDPSQPPLDQMRQTIDDEKKGLEDLATKIENAKNHAKQLHDE